VKLALQPPLKISEALGQVPQAASDYVRMVVRRDKMECQYDGMIARDVQPFMICETTGEKLVCDEETLRTHPEVKLYADFHFPKTLNAEQFGLELRVTNDDLRLGFSREAIADALTHWHETAKKTRLHDLFLMVGAGTPPPRFVRDAQVHWDNLANKIFDTSHDAPEFIIAVHQKFMWQIKRKVLGLPVTNHLMPVILGPQGKGKSTFVSKLVEPLKELTLEVDFKMIEDERNVEMWSSYILFLDEMGYASKANVDTIKHAITASTLTRRPMRSNGKITVAQNATFIGCSNKTLAQLIKDPTGIRRFVGVQMTNPSRETMNSLDYLLLWQSVDPHGADPMIPFMDLLTAKQDEEREKGRVEEWLSQFDPNAAPMNAYGRTFSELSRNGKIAGADLFTLYSEWEGVMYPGSYGRTSNQEFGHEMKRLLDSEPQKVPFEKAPRNAKGVVWQYTGPLNVHTLGTVKAKVGYVR
jgi:hypothetical protein